MFRLGRNKSLLTWRQSFLYLVILIILVQQIGHWCSVQSIHSRKPELQFFKRTNAVNATDSTLFHTTFFRQKETRKVILAFSAIAVLQPY